MAGKEGRSGYIALYRSILDWEWYDDINTYRVFLHLLLTVNFEDKCWHGMTVYRGERIFSFALLATELGLSFQQVRTAVAHLESTGEVTRRKTRKGTVITVKNFDFYQAPTREPTSHQQAVNKQISKPPTRHQQYTSNKDNKEYIYALFDRFWEAYPKKKNKKKAREVFTRLKPSEELLEKMLSSIDVAKQSGEWNDIQFIPYPTTWLNGERWEDELSQTTNDEEDDSDVL